MSLNKELKDIIEESESECECVYGEECYSCYKDKIPVYWGVEENNSDLDYNPECITINSNKDDDGYTDGFKLSWFNWVNICFKQEDDEITFSISTKDPRGADISFRVYKYNDEIKFSNREKDEEIRHLKDEKRLADYDLLLARDEISRLRDEKVTK
jgi:hypothetical protein